MGLLTGLQEAFRRLDCFVLGQADYIVGGASRFLGLTPTAALAPINALRRLNGCDPANDPVPPTGPFAGGQCQGINYTVAYSYNIIGTAGQTIEPRTNATYQVRGPLQRFEVESFQGGVRIITVNGFGTEIVASDSSPQGNYRNFSVDSVIRNDGLPDDCGSLPGPPTPPINIDIDVPVTFVDEGDNVVNVDIPVTFGPFNVDFNGDISFPFDFSFEGSDFTGDVVFGPRFRLNINPPRLPPGPINPPDSDTEPQTPAPLAPRGNKIQGVIVVANVVNDGEVSSYEADPIPDIYVPRLGSVKFAYSFGISTVWSNDIDVKGTSVFIPCPFSQGADAVQGSPREGITFSLSAVTGPPLATVADLV